MCHVSTPLISHTGCRGRWRSSRARLRASGKHLRSDSLVLGPRCRAYMLFETICYPKDVSRFQHCLFRFACPMWTPRWVRRPWWSSRRGLGRTRWPSSGALMAWSMTMTLCLQSPHYSDPGAMWLKQTTWSLSTTTVRNILAQRWCFHNLWSWKWWRQWPFQLLQRWRSSAITPESIARSLDGEGGDPI